MLEEGLRVRELGDRRWEARAIRQLAIVHRNDGDAKTAIAMLAECMSIFGELEDRRGMAVVFRNRGDAWRVAGEPDEAGGDLSRALDAFQAIDDRRWTARTQLSIAGLARVRRDWAAASGCGSDCASLACCCGIGRDGWFWGGAGCEPGDLRGAGRRPVDRPCPGEPGRHRGLAGPRRSVRHGNVLHGRPWHRVRLLRWCGRTHGRAD